VTVADLSSSLVFPVQLRDEQLLALHAADPERYPALLESVANHSVLGRFDVLFAYPQARVILTSDGVVHDRGVRTDQSFEAALDAWWRSERVRPSRESLPFTGGWLLYLGYELAQQLEPVLHLPRSDDAIVAAALRIPVAVIRDSVSGDAWIVAESGYEGLAHELKRELAQPREHAVPMNPVVRDVQEDDPAQYIDAIERCQEYIRAGDIYQANLSRRWHARLPEGASIADLYQSLRRANPSPFAAVMQLDGLAIVSSSPERLIEVRDGWISSRPIAGTRPRAVDVAQDQELMRELREHPKERAEHIMLIDLERNDLGRLCEPGSVEVNEYMTIETYAHVHHIVSNIRGRLRAQSTPGQIIAATFPGGTITGCPKIRCMQIIAELEGRSRGPYTGSLGYLNRDGSMDLNILIRTLEVRGQGLSFRAGAGIVADSIPDRELAETRAKARGLLRAVSEAAEL
jgi:anthranilate synthase component I